MQKILLFVFLLLIPTQLGRHFWPEWSLVVGMRVDYLSPTLYLIDIIWFILLGLNWQKIKLTKWWIVFFILGMINILVATNKWVAGYEWLRIGQWLITLQILLRDKTKVLSYLKYIIPIWVVFESFLGLGQMLIHRNIGGLFYWFGERTFNLASPGIALWSINGVEWLRAYGTFSHPNSLAGFLLVSLILWSNVIKKRSIWFWLIWIVGLLGIIVSGSRVVWVLSMGFILLNLKNRIFAGVILIVGGLVFWKFGSQLGGWDSEGIQKRIELMKAAVEMWKQSPLFGVGLNNFLVKLPEFRTKGGIFWLQPVHNIPILWLAESGLVGVISFLVVAKKLITKKSLVWGVILVMSLIDHYWWTLPQNWWLLSVVVAVMK